MSLGTSQSLTSLHILQALTSIQNVFSSISTLASYYIQSKTTGVYRLCCHEMLGDFSPTAPRNHKNRAAQSVFVTQALPWINPQTFEKSSRFPFKVAKLEGCELSAKSSHDTQQCQSTVLSQHRGESRGKTNREVERAR